MVYEHRDFRNFKVRNLEIYGSQYDWLEQVSAWNVLLELVQRLGQTRNVMTGENRLLATASSWHRWCGVSVSDNNVVGSNLKVGKPCRDRHE